MYSQHARIALRISPSKMVGISRIGSLDELQNALTKIPDMEPIALGGTLAVYWDWLFKDCVSDPAGNCFFEMLSRAVVVGHSDNGDRIVLSCTDGL